MLKRLLATALIALLLLPVQTFAALQTIPGDGMWIFHTIGDGGSITFGTWGTLDGTGDRIAWIFPAPKTGNISEIGWHTRTVTTGDIVDVRLETVDTADANPSGTLCGTNSNVNVTVASSDDNVWENSALTASCAVTKGDKLAIVLSAATFVSSGNMQIAGYTNNTTGDLSLFPYSRVNSTGSYAAVSSVMPILTLKYDDGSYAPLSGGTLPVLPIANATAFGASAITTSTTPDEIGLKFQVPFSGSLCGAGAQLDFSSAGGTYDIVLYDSGSTAIATFSGDTDQVLSNAAGAARANEFPIPATTISINSTYRLVVKPTSANVVTVADFDVNAAGMLAAVPGGTNFVKTQRTDAGAWTDTTTKRPFIGLKFCSLDDGVGGGGGSSKKVIGAWMFPSMPDGPASSTPLILLALSLMLVGALVRGRRRLAVR